MNPKLLFTFSFFLFTAINAQIKKGSWIIGGQASYNQVDYYPNTNYSYSSKNPTAVISIGKAFKDNDVYGISAGYLSNTYSSTIYIGGYAQTGDRNTYSASVFNRKYEKIISALYAFSEVGAGLSYSHYRTTNSYNGFLYCSPGIAYRVRKKLFIEFLLPNLARLSYYHSKTTYFSNTDRVFVKENEVALTSNLNLASFATGLRINL